MKNKWYEVLGAGLLSVTAMYFSLALVVTGCSSDNSGVTGGDTEEYSEVVEPSSNEEDIEEPSSSEKEEVAESSDTEETSKAEEPSDVEESSNSEDAVKTEKPADVEEPADTEEKSEQAESSNSEEKSEQAESLNTEETPEPAESTSSEEETPEPAETSNPSEETESSNQSEGAGLAPQPDNVQSSDCFTKECEFIRDTITGFLMDLSVEDLFDVRGQFIERPDKEWRADEYGMDKEDFYAEYSYEYYNVLDERLIEEGILWKGFNWTNLNKPDYRFKADMDTVLFSLHDGVVELYAGYKIRCVSQKFNVDMTFYIELPIRFRAKED